MTHRTKLKINTINYKVDVNIHPKDEMRESIIDNILEDKSSGLIPTEKR